MEPRQWKLLSNSGDLGVLTLVDVNQPWFNCEFAPTSNFEAVKYLFDEEVKLLNEEREEEWDKAQDALSALHLSLKSLEGQDVINDFLLHIEGDNAWFRY